ncbi:hypothetical protein Sjap_011922 [Stephania japonica]|uniref:Uncharacterized protein n=1 Tax=Stephania japonica TaxID=461633 RepID=A0AAP0JD94_9MAGN
MEPSHLLQGPFGELWMHDETKSPGPLEEPWKYCGIKHAKSLFGYGSSIRLRLEIEGPIAEVGKGGAGGLGEEVDAVGMGSLRPSCHWRAKRARVRGRVVMRMSCDANACWEAVIGGLMEV